MTDIINKGGPEIRKPWKIKETHPPFKNEWTDTIDALKAGNKAKDELIASLLEDTRELQSSLAHNKVALLVAREDYERKVKRLSEILKPWWKKW